MRGGRTNIKVLASMTIIACFASGILVFFFAVSPLQSELQERDENYERCRAIMEDLRGQIEDLEEDKQQLRSTIESDKKKLKKAQDELDDLQQQYSSIRSQFSSLDARCNGWEVRIDKLQTEATRLATDLGRCEEDKEELQNSYSECNYLKNSLEIALEDEIYYSQETASRATECEDLLSEMSNTTSILREELLSCQNDGGTATNQLELLKEENTLCKESLETIQAILGFAPKKSGEVAVDVSNNELSVGVENMEESTEESTEEMLESSVSEEEIIESSLEDSLEQRGTSLSTDEENLEDYYGFYVKYNMFSSAAVPPDEDDEFFLTGSGEANYIPYTFAVNLPPSLFEGNDYKDYYESTYTYTSQDYYPYDSLSRDDDYY